MNSKSRNTSLLQDQFQRDFFLIRQAEYEQYVKDLGPGMVQQGYLTDPYYFDFISVRKVAISGPLWLFFLAVL